MRRKIIYFLISATVVFALTSGTVSEAAQKTTHGDGAWYTTDVINGDVVYGSAYITLSSGMRASVSKDGGAAKTYSSGTLLSEPGKYAITFISGSGSKEQTSQMSFTIKPETANTDTSKYLPQMYDYGSYDPSLGAGGLVLAGGEKAPALGETYTSNIASFPTAVADPGAGVQVTAVSVDPVSGALTVEALPSVSPAPVTTQQPTPVTTEQPTPVQPITTPEPSNPTTAPEQTDIPSELPGYTPEQPNPSASPEQPGTTPEPYTTPETTPTPEPTEILVNISLASSYYPDFDVYEFTFMSGKYFYTNISNGAITPVGVTLDIPADISVHMHKNGKNADFKNKTPISEEGSYILYLSVYDYSTTPPTHYRAVFRFRIQGKDTFLSDGYGTVPVNSLYSEPLSPTFSEAAPSPMPEIPTPVPTPEPIPDITNPPDEPLPVVTLPDVSGDEQVSPYRSGDYLPFNETYQVMKSMFYITAQDGSGFYSNVPNGMITDSAVRLEFPDGMLKTMYRDDEPFTFDGAPVTEQGSYRCVLSGGQLFSFRIITEPVEDLRLYYPPYGFTVASAAVNGKAVSGRVGHLRLARDGEYTIAIENNEGVNRKLVFTVGVPKPVQEDGTEENAAAAPASPVKTVILVVVLVVLLASGGVVILLRKRRQSM